MASLNMFRPAVAGVTSCTTRRTRPQAGVDNQTLGRHRRNQANNKKPLQHAEPPGSYKS